MRQIELPLSKIFYQYNQNNIMCFSDSKVNSRQTKKIFIQSVDERKRFTSSLQLSKFTVCMLQYMEMILQKKVGETVTEEKSIFDCISCLSSRQSYRNVRKQFQKSFQSCNASQQLDYYIKFLSFMMGKKMRTPFIQSKHTLTTQIVGDVLKNNSEEQINRTYNIQLKGTISWMKFYTITLIPEKYCLILKNLNTWDETPLNLRNYILRQSNHLKQHSYVLAGIVPIQPFNVRFCISPHNQNPSKIINEIRAIYERALKQNVLQWKQLITIVTSNRPAKTENKPPVTNIFEHSNKPDDKKPSKGKQEEAPKIKVTAEKADFVNPLTAKIKDVAKMGLAKKLKQFNEDEQMKKEQSARNQSMMKNQSMRNELNNASSFQSPKNNFINQQQFLKGIKKQPQPEKIPQFLSPLQMFLPKQTTKKPQKQTAKSEENFITEDLFKKKKSSMSEYQYHLQQPKRKPFERKHHENINYAMAPSDTRSESGFKKKERYGEQEIRRLEIIEDNQKPDSSKSLLNELEKGLFSLAQQQQFGNASQLSSEQSFRTIPQMK